MIELPQQPGLAEHVEDAALHLGEVQGFDDHVLVKVAIVTEKGRAEAARAEDLLGLVTLQRKRSVALRVQGRGLADGRQGVVPAVLLQGGAVSVEAGLGLGRGVADDLGHLQERLPGRLKVAGAQLQLAQPIEQGRHLPLLLGRQLAKAVEQLPDLLLLVRAAERQAEPRPDLAAPHPRRIEQGQHLLDQATQTRQLRLLLAAQLRQARRQVQDRAVRRIHLDAQPVHLGIDLVQRIEDLVAIVGEGGQGLADFDQRLAVGRRQLPEIVQHQFVDQLVVASHLLTEEVGESRRQQRWALRSRLPQQPGQVGIIGCKKFGDLGHGLVCGLDHSGEVRIALETGNVLNEGRRVGRLLKQFALAHLAPLDKTCLTHFFGCRG